MKRNFRFPSHYHSAVNRNNIDATLNDRTDQQSRQGESSRRPSVPPLLPPPNPPQIPLELLKHQLPSTQPIEGNGDDSEREIVEGSQNQSTGGRCPISWKSFGNIFGNYYNYCEELRTKLSAEKVISEGLRVDLNVINELLKNEQTEISSQKNKIEELSKVSEQKAILEAKYEKLSGTHTSAKNDLLDKNRRIEFLEKVIKETKGQLEDNKSKVRNLEASDKKLRQESKVKNQEYTNLESKYSAKCTELECKSEELEDLKSKYNIMRDELKLKRGEIINLKSEHSEKCANLSTDLKEKIKIINELRNSNKNLETEKEKSSSTISEKEEEISKLRIELNSAKRVIQNITSASNELIKRIPTISSKVKKKFNLSGNTETQITDMVVKEPPKTMSLEKSGGSESRDGAELGANITLTIESNPVDYCNSSDDVNEEDWTLSKISSDETPEVNKEPDSVGKSIGNKGNPKIILKLSKKIKKEKDS